MVTGIILAAAVVGILGILIGIFLGVASEKFKVQVDEKRGFGPQRASGKQLRRLRLRGL